MSRRGFLVGLTAAVVLPPTAATAEVARSLLNATPQNAAAAARAETAPAAASVGATGQAPQPLHSAAPISRSALPDRGVVSTLPGQGDLLALTVDDGVNTDVVRLYAEFARRTGQRLTFFVNGTYRSWTDNATLLRPLVEAGQIQLGNHSFSHPDLTKLAPSEVADEIRRNDAFLTNTFGVDARPYLRPPYGKHNAATEAVAADLGYTITTMWSGSLADSTVITEDYLLKMADTYFRPHNIVLGHLNHLPVTRVFDQLDELIRSRGLRTVTLDDVFIRPPAL
ncbi:polysaccharide deacetylase family protein [Mycobacterium sp. JS623]|uniref:polysaccharide deacetylase family protein n=1 Tax=Mycobacterium sp. JS623 TaxID=212767 RepID=UPI00059D5AC1|nr:polysaccharide deacetylase family protein [Mycobacterium sp. JS623]